MFTRCHVNELLWRNKSKTYSVHFKRLTISEGIQGLNKNSHHHMTIYDIIMCLAFSRTVLLYSCYSGEMINGILFGSPKCIDLNNSMINLMKPQGFSYML